MIEIVIYSQVHTDFVKRGQRDLRRDYIKTIKESVLSGQNLQEHTGFIKQGQRDHERE